MQANLQPGAVAKLGDPSWHGQWGGEKRLLGDVEHAKVHHQGRFEYVPIDQLQPADAGADEHPLDLLEAGRLTGLRELRQALIRVRLSGRLADILYSVDAADCDFYAYQYKPVLGLLEGPTQSLLVADEVGLGKTIEAGLAWTELRARFDARRLMVLCPAVLRDKWRLELRRRFGVDAEIAKADRVLECLTDPLLQRQGYALVASVQGLRASDEGEVIQVDRRAALARFLSERDDETSLIDLFILDEAHYLRNSETASHRLARAAAADRRVQAVPVGDAGPQPQHRSPGPAEPPRPRQLWRA